MSEYIDNILKCVYPNKQNNKSKPIKNKLNNNYIKLPKNTKLILEINEDEENNNDDNIKEQKEELKQDK